VLTKSNLLIAATGTAVVALLSFQQHEITEVHNEVREIKTFLIQTNENVHYTKNDLTCLAENVYYEAGVEPIEGKYAVAQVTLNRLKTGHWGSSVCAVVHSRAQFSWTLKKKLAKPKGTNWTESKLIAEHMLADKMRVRPLQQALMYHADYVKPNWADRTQYITKVGQHIFYRKGLGSTLDI
jgi:spore germination cell wall hydrolase CwlJ-like protein